MTPAQIIRMQEGRKRAAKARTVVAVKTVRDYRAWLLGGCVGRCPVVPSDAQYAAAREAGEPRSALDRVAA